MVVTSNAGFQYFVNDMFCEMISDVKYLNFCSLKNKFPPLKLKSYVTALEMVVRKGEEIRPNISLKLQRFMKRFINFTKHESYDLRETNDNFCSAS